MHRSCTQRHDLSNIAIAAHSTRFPTCLIQSIPGSVMGRPTVRRAKTDGRVAWCSDSQSPIYVFDILKPRPAQITDLFSGMCAWVGGADAFCACTKVPEHKEHAHTHAHARTHTRHTHGMHKGYMRATHRLGCLQKRNDRRNAIQPKPHRQGDVRDTKSSYLCEWVSGWVSEWMSGWVDDGWQREWAHAEASCKLGRTVIQNATWQ